MSGASPPASTEQEFWSLAPEAALAAAGSSAGGLSAEEARERLDRHGPNRVRRRREAGPWPLLGRQFGSPLVLLLVAAGAVSTAVGDRTDSLILLAIVLASGLVGFYQENSANSAVRRLMHRVAVRLPALRDGREVEVPAEELVPGDVVRLAAGSIVPADLRILRSANLYADQAALTGETFPVEKSAEPVPAETPLAARSSALFAGTHVVSGTATALVVVTGAASELGRLAARLERPTPPPAFERGLARFGVMLIQVTALLAAAVFAATVALDHPALEALLFALALAVGMTPELLPAIVAVTLARGARRMAAARVVVKRPAAIENLGSMDVLCADKTGTLTEGVVRLRGAFSPDGRPDSEVLAAAALNARLQQGLPSPIDDALREEPDPGSERHRKLDEVPYDFGRKRLSVLVAEPGGSPVLITKGAFAKVLEDCTAARLADGRIVPLAEVRRQAEELFARLSAEGQRVLGVARRELPGATRATLADERELTLLGVVAFSDVPKSGIAGVIAELAGLGVSLRIITGDNRQVAETVARAVGIARPRILTGAELNAIPTAALGRRAEVTDVFAEVEPTQKERILLALKRAGHVVGFLGDGINDAPALHTADVGISVDGAVDVAKEAAEIVLLEHDLGVLAEGVRLGRSTFLNTLKYIYVTTSANFGNMVSMAAAVLFLPFLPLLPKQILLNNFLSDFPAMTLGVDRVDAEAVSRPRRWETRSVRRFMVVFGLVSSVFDLGSFAILLFVFHAAAEEFRTAWFVVSLLTEVVVLLVMRTRRRLLRSRPGLPLVATSVAVAAAALAMPFVPALAVPLGFVPLPPRLLAVAVGITLAYGVTTELAKHRFFRRSGFGGGAPG